MKSRIIHILKKAHGFVSGQEIGHELGLSRAAVWKAVTELRRCGYTIKALPRKGYSLEESPDKLYSWEIQPELKTKCFGRSIVHEEAVGSTMDLAALYADRGAEHGSLFCAETQTRGRGRLGRQWSSPCGEGIYASLLLRPGIPLIGSPKMVFVAGVALCDAVSSLTGLDVHIKWPNDLLLGTKKLAGILTELRAESGRIERLIIGIGMNVNTPKKELPPQATSLFAESGKKYSRVRILSDFLFCCERQYERVLKEGFDPLLLDWKKRCRLWGERVVVEMDKVSLQGVVTDLASDGGLIMKMDDGREKKIVTGDILRLRKSHVN
ncbi:MAG TPA: biotin--[acetyl-CoA-carboxylase] ligase [Candidatus Omnitrophota bacterium]|nr:biotin--[acetyl-CoA-carboxylase] ligase [Candidatus Omnitrophota bacterium]